VSAGRGLPAGEFVGWLQLWIWVPFITLITVYLFLLFPDGRLPGPRWRLVSWAAGVSPVAADSGLVLPSAPAGPGGAARAGAGVVGDVRRVVEGAAGEQPVPAAKRRDGPCTRLGSADGDQRAGALLAGFGG
jgi:hypothetical protein